MRLVWVKLGALASAKAKNGIYFFMEQEQLKENVDFYWDELGRMVLTKDYLLKRGSCCENDCRHCPYGSILKD